MRILPALLLIALALAAAGCTSSSSPAVTPDVTPVVTTLIPQTGDDRPAITVEVLGLTPQYSVDKPFSYLAQVKATNAGTVEATGVAVVVKLVDTGTGDAADTKNILIERFVAGDMKIYTVRLSGAPDQEYRVETEVLFNQP
ncbi:MAG: hypothetical protein PHP59_00300 [Methanofollis sp.]|uniref:hypothetical protein n=1 Tax=Methanofollis sp. TaxID=2052835 RepID=UPI00261BF036|nr:hypothetical protein [Methanofollis sp.]MDD4253805.1 hypothetical protein [Methanofollis sp.]